MTLNIIINTLDENKSTCIDQYRSKDIKFLKSEIALMLAEVINLSLKTENFPEALKSAMVRPIQKSGQHKSFENVTQRYA